MNDKDDGCEDSGEFVHQKVQDIFRELAGSRATQLGRTMATPAAQAMIQEAVSAGREEGIAHDIAFHLTDWGSDAAFIVAVQLYPERFTKEEIEQGVLDFLIHAPNHVAAAAKLADWPITDVFKVGAIDGF